ncbi:TonB-dependent receptor plug domain-containing protein [Longitalea luteola]|uniref:TonB-dependent receptor plug domain-containing protein n=1 Tax=Longitalea luteola TaxID=2812563 RepID=UPI001A969789|nr:TonB-dependent receptor plug domain-containing protein [Longitalea luteola]
MRIFYQVIAVAILLLAPQLILAQLVTLHIDKGEVKAALDSIQQQTKIPVIDTYKWLRRKESKKVSIHVEQATLYSVLQLLGKNQIFYLTLANAIIVVLREEYEEALRAGQVLDQNEQPVANATVTDLRNGLSAVTNANGNFFMDSIGPNTKIRVSGLNIEPVTTIYHKKITIRVQRHLTNNVAIVAINTGYQHFKKNNKLGSDFSVNLPLFQQRVSINVAQRLEGIVPALALPVKNARLFQPDYFSIGARTSLLNPDPLIIIDNFPLQGNLININPDDIQDITVLRDAAALNIWGARAANGVVILKTRSSNYFKRFRLSFNTSVSFAARPNLFTSDRMSAADHIHFDTTVFKSRYFDHLLRFPTHPSLSQVVEELYRNVPATQRLNYLDSLAKLDNRNDLENYFYRPSMRQHYFIQLEGGGKAYNYYMSTGYDRIHPEWQLSREERTTSLLKFNTKFRTLEIGTGISLAQHLQKNMNGVPELLLPYQMLLDNNNKKNNMEVAIPYKYRYNYIDTAGNNRLLDWRYYPLREFRLRNHFVTELDYRYNVALKWDAGKIVPGLGINTYFQHQGAFNQLKEVHAEESFFTRDLVNSYSQLTPGAVFRPIPAGDIANLYRSKYSSTNMRLQFSYTKKWNNKSLVLMAGKDRVINEETHTRERIYDYNIATGAGKTNIDYKALYPMYYFPAFKMYIPSPQLSQSLFHIYASTYSNALFRWREKYDLTASARYERSNLFARRINNRFSPLTSVGLAWQLSSERFYHSIWLPFVRLSATYGTTGYPPYYASAWRTVDYSGLNSNGNPFAFLTNAPQNTLRWERVRNLNIGLNLRTLNDRIELNINWYRKSSHYLIGYNDLDPTLGTDLTGNVADMSSRNLDIVIESKNIMRPFSWRTGFMMTIVNEKVTHVKDTVLAAWKYCDPNYFTTVIGKPLYGLFSFPFKGLDPYGNPLGEKGTQYMDMVMAKGSNSLTYHGRATPAVFGSITNDFSYKQLNLSVTVLYKLNYYFRRQSINYYDLYQGVPTGSADFSRRWRQPGDEKTTTVPSIPVTAAPDPNRDIFYNYSNVLVERADHLRLQNIQLSYELEDRPLKKGQLRMANVFLNCSNTWIIWRANKWGIDPEQHTRYRQPVLYTIGFRGTFK